MSSPSPTPQRAPRPALPVLPALRTLPAAVLVVGIAVAILGAASSDAGADGAAPSTGASQAGASQRSGVSPEGADGAAPSTDMRPGGSPTEGADGAAPSREEPSAAKGAPAAKKIPVIFDSDLGDDIDDTWALVFLLKSPELDLKLVTTDHGNTVYRAKIAARILEIAGRTDVPIGIGLRLADSEGPQAPWVKDYDLARYPGKVHQDGVGALIDAIMGSKEPITLICVGPVPNIEAALQKEPRIAERARFVGMHGSVRRGYGGKATPDAEYNVKANIAACQKVLSAPWDITITPLDTCGLVRLKGAKYAAVRDCPDPTIRALIENYRIWCGKNPERADSESSVLFDTVAVYLAFSTELCVMEKLGIRVDDRGFTVEDPGAKKMLCAMDWKSLPDFEALLVKRLTGK